MTGVEMGCFIQYHTISISFSDILFFFSNISHTQGTQLLLSDGTVSAIYNKSGPDISYTVRNIGMYLVIDADIGLTVMWKHKTTVYIILQPHHMVS